MPRYTLVISFLLLFRLTQFTFGQELTDSNTPLHLLQPNYPIDYGGVTKESITEELEQIYDYLNSSTPFVLVDSTNQKPSEDLQNLDGNFEWASGKYRLFSYEWGVTYAGMLSASEATGITKFKNYTFDRLGKLATIYPIYKAYSNNNPSKQTPIESVLEPEALDDAGSLCAAMIKAEKLGMNIPMNEMIENFINYIMTKQYRLDDGTFARNRPLENTLWLDDIFMSVPALAQMGNRTGEQKYFDEAARQVESFFEKMFDAKKGIFMHGKVVGVDIYPSFHWARANGWAIMALVELLDVMPDDHPKKLRVLSLFHDFVQGLVSYQSGSGFWHQLLDRYDSYPETSATAIYTYSLAKAINKGWLSYKVFGPIALSGWSAVSSKINQLGQIEGVCVGTGMAFDPVFYYHRPVSVYAAHGYGPTLLAGAEIFKMIDKRPYKIEETAIQFSNN